MTLSLQMLWFACRCIRGQLGFGRAGVQPLVAATGRPGNQSGDMLRLYIQGYLNQIRSSRHLEKVCVRDLEALWLMRRLIRTTTPSAPSGTTILKRSSRRVRPSFSSAALMGSFEGMSWRWTAPRCGPSPARRMSQVPNVLPETSRTRKRDRLLPRPSQHHIDETVARGFEDVAPSRELQGGHCLLFDDVGD
jgi:hypothetical protein